MRQARAVAGKDAVLRVLEADVDSRVPERRSLLTPLRQETEGRIVELGASSVYSPQAGAGEDGRGRRAGAVESVAVEAVREEWLVEDRWWTPKPLRRRYFELVLADGRNVVVFREADRWLLQRA